MPGLWAPAFLSPRPSQHVQVHPQERHSLTWPYPDTPEVLPAPATAPCPVPVLGQVCDSPSRGTQGPCCAPTADRRASICPGPSTLPFPQDAGWPPRASTEWRSAASVLVLQEVQGRGRDPPAKSPGDTPWPKDQAASAQLLSSQAAAVPWSRHATSAGSELPGMAGILPAPHAWLEAAGGPRAELG